MAGYGDRHPLASGEKIKLTEINPAMSDSLSKMNKMISKQRRRPSLDDWDPVHIHIGGFRWVELEK